VVLGKGLPPKHHHHQVIAKYRDDDIDREHDKNFWRDQRSSFLEWSHLFSKGLVTSFMALAD